MSKTKQQKHEIVDALSQKIGKIKSAVFASISGYTMPDADKLRASGRKQGVDLAVSKKSLLVRAFESKGITIAREELSGSVLTSFGYEDEVAPAKLVFDFAKGREEQIKILGGVFEGKFVQAEVIKRLAKLPSKLELYAKLVGSINAPVSGLVNVLAGNLRGFVRVLDAIKSQKS